MITEFGKCIRHIRLDEGHTLKEMAHRLNVHPSYLSAIETGKRCPTYSILNKICNTYKLIGDDFKSIIRNYQITKGEVCIDLEDITECNKEMLLKLSEVYKYLSEDTVNKIYEILNSVKI